MVLQEKKKKKKKGDTTIWLMPTSPPSYACQYVIPVSGGHRHSQCCSAFSLPGLGSLISPQDDETQA